MGESETPLRGFPQFVEGIGREVTSDDIDTYARLIEIEDTSYTTRTILGAWEKQQTEERALRRTYAKWLLAALFVQIVIINLLFVLLGLGLLSVQKWVATSFIVSVFAEVSSMLFVVVRYLFPVNPKSLLSNLLRQIPRNREQRHGGD